MDRRIETFCERPDTLPAVVLRSLLDGALDKEGLVRLGVVCALVSASAAASARKMSSSSAERRRPISERRERFVSALHTRRRSFRRTEDGLGASTGLVGAGWRGVRVSIGYVRTAGES